MSSNYQSFWTKQRYAVIGHGATRNFPVLTYRGLKQQGRKVAAIEPDGIQVDGDKSFTDLSQIPFPPEAVVLEVEKEETAAWVLKVAEAGIKDLWIHMGTETEEAKQIAAEHKINLRTGTCAVMYVTPGLTYHSLHRWIMKALGKF